MPHPTTMQENGVPEPQMAASTTFEATLEKKLLRKMDLALLPLFALIYCANFIDRTAVGNAKIAGLERDLGMAGYDFNIALTVFYIFYIAVEVPSNLLLKQFGSRWLALMVTGFGSVALGSAFVKSYKGLLVTRVFLGLTEGGTLSGLAYILGRFYRRRELVLRIGLFFGTAPTLAGAFGGLLASGLLTLDDIGAVSSWRKIFFVEGVITTGIGLALFFILPDDPRTTRLFTEEERALAIARLDADRAELSGPVPGKAVEKERTTFRLIWRSFSFNTMVYSLAYLLINISFQGLSLFLPTVITTLLKLFTNSVTCALILKLNLAVVESQLRTVPPFLVGLVWALAVIVFSHRAKQRALPVGICASLMVIGYSIAISTTNPHARYAGCFLCVAGGTPSGPILLAWGAENAAPDTVRAVATALIPGIGAFGSIIAVWSYLPTDAPNFRKGNSLNLGTSILTCLLMVIVWFYGRWENAKRERGERDYRLEGKSEKEIDELGSRDPRFRYHL